VSAVGERDGGDRGAATVWTLALLGVVLLSGLVAAAMGAQAVARQRVSTVADVAALAAAQSVVDPCGEADRIARANRMTLLSCSPDGRDVILTVGSASPDLVRRVVGLLGHEPDDVTATARAGPPDDPLTAVAVH